MLSLVSVPWSPASARQALQVRMEGFQIEVYSRLPFFLFPLLQLFYSSNSIDARPQLHWQSSRERDRNSCMAHNDKLLSFPDPPPWADSMTEAFAAMGSHTDILR